MRAASLIFLTGLLAPALASAMVAPAGGQEASPGAAAAVSIANDPDIQCAGAIRRRITLWSALCRNPFPEERREIGRLHVALDHYVGRLDARYGDARRIEDAIQTAASGPDADESADECVTRARGHGGR